LKQQGTKRREVSQKISSDDFPEDLSWVGLLTGMKIFNWIAVLAANGRAAGYTSKGQPPQKILDA